MSNSSICWLMFVHNLTVIEEKKNFNWVSVSQAAGVTRRALYLLVLEWRDSGATLEAGSVNVDLV